MASEQPLQWTAKPCSDKNSNLTDVPKKHQDFSIVFSKSCALYLPPHRSYDCATYLLPAAPLPSNRQNSQIPKEKLCSSIYSLFSGIICSSTSPVGTGFFCCFWEKDKSSRSYTDYRVLNHITINKYLLTLVDSVWTNPFSQDILQTWSL